MLDVGACNTYWMDLTLEMAEAGGGRTLTGCGSAHFPRPTNCPTEERMGAFPMGQGQEAASFSTHTHTHTHTYTHTCAHTHTHMHARAVLLGTPPKNKNILLNKPDTTIKILTLTFT